MATKRAVWIGAGLVGVGAAAVLLGRRRRRAASTVLEDRDHAVATDDLVGEEVDLVSHDGGELAVTLTGPEDGPVVVLAHCWGGSRQTWAPVSRRLLAAGCRVVRWDQRGHGRSRAGHKGHSVEGLADDLATVLTDLDLREVVLVGHSMGGMTVQAFATHHHQLFHERTRGVVLVATAGFGMANPATARTPDLIRSARVERLFERPGTGRLLVRATFGRGAHPHHVEVTRADFVATPQPVRAEFAEAMQAMDLRDGVAKIDVPTTILVGSRDTLTPLPLSRALAATIPGSTLEVLTGLGHMLPYEAPDEVTAATLSHVAWPAAPAGAAPTG
ncbi:MAG: alpha/beta fold hydrolase [Acidimicrobiales bacterium]